MKRRVRVDSPTPAFGLDHPDLLAAHPEVAVTIARKLPTLRGMASKYSKKFRLDRYDLLQEGFIAILEASRTYDASWGPFDLFVEVVARRAMQNSSRWWLVRRRERKVMNLEDLLPIGDPGTHRSSEQEMAQAVSVGQGGMASVDLLKVAALMETVLTSQERNAFYMVVVEDQAQKDVAITLQVSRPRVTQLVQSARRKLRLHLEE